MQPRTAEMLRHIDRHYDELRSALAEIPVALQTVRPTPDQWSVAGVVHHLAIVQNRVADVLRTRLETARAEGLEADSAESPALSQDEINRILNRSRRFRTSEAAEPQPDVDLPTALRQLAGAHEKFRALVLDADGLDVSKVVHPHVFLGPFTFYQWAAFVGAHQGRHLDQIREIMAQLSV